MTGLFSFWMINFDAAKMPIDRSRYAGLSKLEFRAKQVVEGFLVGLHKSPFHGFSVEFAEHRAYDPGQSTRHIDWKLYARTDRLFLKRYEEETNLRCQLVLDISSSMYFPEITSATDGPEMNKLDFSVHACAALIQLLRKQRDAVGLSLFSDQLHLHERARSNAVHLQHLMQQLEHLISADAPRRDKRTSAVEAIHEVAQQIHRRSLVVIFSDMVDNSERADELLDALQHLRFNKHEVILFHVVDRKKELELELENRPYQFIDMETGESVKADPATVREGYRAAMATHWQDLKVRCGQNRIELVEADINQGFEPVMLQFMVKRSKMY